MTDESFDIRLETPEEWRTAPWALIEPTPLQVDGIEDLCAFVSGVLADGTNLHVLTYPGGQRLLRCSPHTDWAIEERYTGHPLDSEPLEKLWRTILDGARDALDKATRDNGGKRPGA